MKKQQLTLHPVEGEPLAELVPHDEADLLGVGQLLQVESREQL